MAKSGGQTSIDIVKANAYREQVDGIVRVTAKIMQTELQRLDYNVPQKEQAAILEKLKKHCKAEVAKKLTNILQTDATLRVFYVGVSIYYQDTSDRFDVTGVSEDEPIVQPVQLMPPIIGQVADTMVQPLKSPINKLYKELGALNAGINKDLEEELTKIIAQQDNYRPQAKYRTGSLAIPIVASFAAMLAIGGAVALYMKASELQAAYLQAINDIPGLADYLKHIMQDIKHPLFPDFCEQLFQFSIHHKVSLDTLSKVVDLANLDKGPLAAAGILTIIAAIIAIATTVYVVHHHRKASSERIEMDIRQPSEEEMQKAVEQAAQAAVALVEISQQTGAPVVPLGSEVKGEATDFAVNMCNRLISFSTALQEAVTQKEPIAQQV